MIKRVLVIVSTIAMFLIVTININSNLDFLYNENNAGKFVENKFDFDFELIESKMGKSSYPAPRNDSFLFYDRDNELYFIVICCDKEFRDLYEESTREKIILP